MKEWELAGNNIALQGDGFYISYNDATGQEDPLLYETSKSMDALLGVLLGQEVKRQEETAICFDDTFLILNGDFRKEYEKLVDKGLDACVEFYNKHKAELRSIWSTDYVDSLGEN